MSHIIIQPTDRQELQFLLSLLEKLRISNRVIDEATMEDLGLALAMKQVDRTDKVSETEVMDLLNAKL